VRLYLDHDVDVACAARLLRLGHDVLTTRAVGRTESLDEQQLVFATQEGRVFLTHNRRDFRSLHYQWTEEGRRHSGIIISSHLLLDELERRFLRLLATYTEADMQGRLIPLHEFR